MPSLERRHRACAALLSAAAIARTLTSLTAAALMSSCAAQTPYDPFKTPAREVRDRVRTIAVAPLIARATVADREAARAQIEPLVTARLQAAGFAVVPSEAMKKRWRQAADDVGAVFDPVSGEVDKDRFKTVEAAVYRDLGSELHVDAVLYLTIDPVVVYLPGQTVAYCGTSKGELLYWPTSAGALRDRATFAVVLCLNAGLSDLEGRTLYGIRYGLEPVETYAEQTRAVKPIAERLQDPGRIAQAVEQTVGPLADAGRSAGK
jgi:hypothetical protein